MIGRMNTDTYFEIGSTHEVCQDYALAGKINDKLSFAIVTDGCTESHNKSREVDFGARLVAYAARDALLTIFKDYRLLSDSASGAESHRVIIAKQTTSIFLSLKKQLSLHELACDATLVIAITDGETGYGFIYGDGGILVTHCMSGMTYDEITFLSSAPYYLVYPADANRNAGYKLQFGASPVIKTRYDFSLGFNTPVEDVKATNSQAPEISENLYGFTSFMYTDVASISVTSDGIKSFQSVGDNGIVEYPAIAMVPQFVGFKNTHGNFVQRRLRRMKEENEKIKAYHYDDISLASIVV